MSQGAQHDDRSNHEISSQVASLKNLKEDIKKKLAVSHHDMASTEASTALSADESKVAQASSSLANVDLANSTAHIETEELKQSEKEDFMTFLNQKLRILGKLRYSNFEIEFDGENIQRLDGRILLYVYDTYGVLTKTELLRGAYNELRYLRFCSP